LIRPKRSTLRSRGDVTLERIFQFRHSSATFTGVPIIAANMDTIASFEMAEALAKHKVYTAVHKHYRVDEWAKFCAAHPDILQYLAVSQGTSDADFKKTSEILEQTKVTTICLDVANGYSEHFVNAVRRVREQYPRYTIMAGNVVTGEMVEELILSGADIVKVGIGPGSVCTTRRKAGVGYPQLSAVIECADAAHGLSGLIISDGGCTNPGDVAKAFGAGADFVMLGGMLAGHDECGGTQVEIHGKRYCEFYGMSSATAMMKHSGGVANYRASEGKHVYVPYRGPVENTILDILGGVRSACTYVGASQLKHLSKRTTFIRVTQQTNEIFAAQGIEKSDAGVANYTKSPLPAEKEPKSAVEKAEPKSANAGNANLRVPAVSSKANTSHDDGKQRPASTSGTSPIPASPTVTTSGRPVRTTRVSAPAARQTHNDEDEDA